MNSKRVLALNPFHILDQIRSKSQIQYRWEFQTSRSLGEDKGES